MLTAASTRRRTFYGCRTATPVAVRAPRLKPQRSAVRRRRHGPQARRRRRRSARSTWVGRCRACDRGPEARPRLVSRRPCVSHGSTSPKVPSEVVSPPWRTTSRGPSGSPCSSYQMGTPSISSCGIVPTVSDFWCPRGVAPEGAETSAQEAVTCANRKAQLPSSEFQTEHILYRNVSRQTAHARLGWKRECSPGRQRQILDPG